MLRRIALLATLAVVSGAASAQAATVAVTTTADQYGTGAGCSLREAIESANGDAEFDNCTHTGSYGDDTVTVPAGQYTLSVGSAGEDSNQQGDLDVSDSLTIAGDGNGPTCSAVSTTCIDADDLDRALDILNGSNPVAVTLRNLTVSDGDAGGSDGGAVSSLQSDAALTLEHVTVASSDAANGGAIRSDGDVTLTDSLLSGNSATGSGGGVSQGDSNLTVSDSLLSGNIAGGGGGISVASGASAGIFTSTISDNEATASDGGGIANGGGLNLFWATIDSNEARGGGGVATTSGAGITASTLSANRATGTCGGGDGDGGAIRQLGPSAGDLQAVNSTISGNSAGCRGGGVMVFDTVGTTSLNAVTVADNSAAAGAGGVDNEADVNGLRRLDALSTIFSGNAPAGCGGDGLRFMLGHNLDSGASCGLGGSDLVGMDPLLGPLRFNGGPTRTRLPVTFSPVVNFIPGPCSVKTDQRGVARPVGGRCDVGAVEATPAPLCTAVGASIAGTPGNDVLVGTPGGDVIAGLGGNDAINGGGGNDLICAGAGNDVVAGGAGNDRLRGEAGNDKLFGGPGRDVLEGGAGKDKLKGGKGKDKLKQK
jgi:CSLREA domain-containing protein